MMGTKHGMHRTPEYNSWVNMRQRCRDVNHPMFEYYGKRGINVCPEWENFSQFYADMGPCNGLSLDRIDNDKGYSPANCRWATKQEQSNNRRFCIAINFNGVTKNLTQWSRDLSIPKGTLYRRYKAGWSVERMLAC
jgi:hypothetical protein